MENLGDVVTKFPEIISL